MSTHRGHTEDSNRLVVKVVKVKVVKVKIDRESRERESKEVNKFRLG
jgi:hypothetical protein